ncbi:MAG: hypothetical protein CMJ40_07900 [Phycisphaerae bacterium]|nr:hypothetical protein [Phycisphaerae bacterium]|tara:strand:+ start:372 stop:806 length:435 start_codon:yes stop_codon:yes gene_type:complete
MVDAKKSMVKGVRFPNLYLWLTFLSALDVVLTRVILYFGGTEVNPLADWIIDQWGQMGMSLFKFAIVAFVIIICEYTARMDMKMAFRLALAGCIISALPVLWSTGLIIELILTFDPTAEPPPPALPEGLSPASMIGWMRTTFFC